MNRWHILRTYFAPMLWGALMGATIGGAVALGYWIHTLI